MEKFKTWDSKLLADTYVLAAQFQTNIEHIGKQVNAIRLEELPPSAIPTSTLYEMCIGYRLLYDKIIEYDLIQSGSPRTQYIKH